MQKSNMKYNHFFQLHIIKSLHSQIYFKYLKNSAVKVQRTLSTQKNNFDSIPESLL